MLAYAFEEYPILTPRPGWSEHDPARYWDCACRLLRGVIAESGVAPGDIKGIAVSSAVPSMVLVDEAHTRSGTPTTCWTVGRRRRSSG